MSTRSITTLLAIALLTPALGAAEQDDKALARDIQQLATNQIQFSKGLYDQLNRESGNVFFSPYSVQSALAMTMAGAKNLTAQEMHSALSLPFDLVHARPEPGAPQPWLHYPWPQQRVHKAAGKLAKSIEQAGEHKSIDIAIANSIWPAANFEMKPPFVATLQKHYGAAVTPTTFPEPGRATINQWVEGKTSNLIKNLLPPGSVNVDTQLVLVNAIYFKGNWQSPFVADITRDRPFHLTADKKVDVPTMFQSERFKYFADDTKQVLEMPYKGRELSMVVVLPTTADGMKDVESKLDMVAIGQKLSQTRKQEVNVYLPKFKMSYTKALNEPLQAMGMKLAFTGRADFSGMSDKPLFISLVQHKAFVEVNETGSEAAAATAVVLAESAMINQKPPPTFRADRPFVFYIRHIPTGSILFMGRMTDPRS
jgi:serpin B